MVVVIMLLTPAIRVSAYAMPLWLFVVYAVYRVTGGSRRTTVPAEERRVRTTAY
jgi:aromatic amino acid transport protein AroP